MIWHTVELSKLGFCGVNCVPNFISSLENRDSKDLMDLQVCAHETSVSNLFILSECCEITHNVEIITLRSAHRQ